MTSPDPSTNSADDTQTRLRVGGWLPPYQAFPHEGDPHTPTVVYRSRRPARADSSYELSAETKSERRRSTAVFCAAVACLLMIGVALTQLSERRAGGDTSPEALVPAAPFLPSAYVPAAVIPSAAFPAGAAEPAQAASPPPTRQVSRPSSPAAAATTPATRTPTRRPGPKPQPSRTPVPPPPPAASGLPIDAPISLELAGAPGLRVRHRDFRGRVDRIGPSSSALDRADSRFIVRRGLADGDCVSFESGNYPGRFLRHRNFEIRLDRTDRSTLFDQDATFCPETRGSADVVVLRARNYPERFVTESRGLLSLTPATTGTATRFVVRPPL